jgi:hypothetical protein
MTPTSEAKSTENWARKKRPFGQIEGHRHTSGPGLQHLRRSAEPSEKPPSDRLGDDADERSEVHGELGDGGRRFG